MTKIDIISGFLGAGKTTLIKKLIAESYKGEKLVLVENEFGEIGVDGGFMQDAGIEVSEVVEKYAPDRIIIEPSGVGKLSDVIRAAQGANTEGKAELNSFTAVVDATKAKMYMKNFGEFFNDQIENAGCIIISRTQKTDDAKLEAVVALLREHNPEAVIVLYSLMQFVSLACCLCQHFGVYVLVLVGKCSLYQRACDALQHHTIQVVGVGCCIELYS